MSYTNPNAPRDHLHDDLKTLLQTLSAEEVPTEENWQVGYGPALRRYSRAPYWDAMDSHDALPNGDNRTTVLRLLYSPTGNMVHSSWISHTNYIGIRFGSDWDPEYNQDNDNDTVIPRSEAGPTGSPRVAEKYMIGGPLCDPVVTGTIETAATAVRNQSPRVKAGADLNHLCEVLAAHRTHILISDEYRKTLPNIDDLPGELFDEDVDTVSPLQSVSGIGNTTIKRFASRFGVYPNLRTAERADFNGLSPGWGHHPDLDKMDAVITAITEHYHELNKQSDWPGSEIDLDQFAEYPIGNPINHGDI